LWQRCFSEALALSGSALPIFRSYGNPKQLAEALVLKADIYYHSGDPEGAIPYLCEALDLSEDSMVDGLESIIRYNLVSAFAKAGYYLEAAEILSAGEISSEGKFDCHRQWLEGFVEQGLCRVGNAERLFIEAREGFTKRRQVGYAALVDLDLAVLYSEQGRDSEIPQLLLEAIPVFERLKCEREALAAVELLRDAVGKNKFPMVLLREVRDKIEQVRINPSSQFVAKTAELCETGPNTRA
ncbi:MAG: tetratricopeptide repeat protein, partial [Deltaproteobacteria bacterium]|nr:tetratricopeptide repeat protein [Deltaproteobacteria bacterium]